MAADKTTICAKSLNILGWVWKEGTLQSDPHKINPLKTCQQPKTVKQLRSYIGFFKALSKCIPNFSSYLSTLEDVVAGKEPNSKTECTSQLSQEFINSQKALDTAKTKRPTDQHY